MPGAQKSSCNGAHVEIHSVAQMKRKCFMAVSDLFRRSAFICRSAIIDFPLSGLERVHGGFEPARTVSENLFARNLVEEIFHCFTGTEREKGDEEG